MGRKQRAVAGEIATVTTRTRELLLVCGKCGNKLKGGYGARGRDELPHALKQELRDRGARGAVRILEVGCLGVCPKGGVTVLRGAAPGELMIVPAGLDLATLLPRLGISTVAPAPAAPAGSLPAEPPPS